jgi:Lrp/AsnC family transcriptional regulator, leucine-responsive regulatory protein
VRALTNLRSRAQFIGEPLSVFSDDLSPHQTALFQSAAGNTKNTRIYRVFLNGRRSVFINQRLNRNRSVIAVLSIFGQRFSCEVCFSLVSEVFLANSNTATLDATDYRILKELCVDGRVADVMLGERVNLSSTAVARRRKILEESGVISGYNANVNMLSLGFTGVVMVAIELSSQAEHVLVEFEREVVKCPSISYCGFVSGDTDFIIMIHVNSFNDYDRIYRKELSSLPHVARIRSSFVMREVARRMTPPVVFDYRK